MEREMFGDEIGLALWDSFASGVFSTVVLNFGK